jgi:hypothetical protein
MEAAFGVETLEDALARYAKPDIFNTDQGSQVTRPQIAFAVFARRAIGGCKLVSVAAKPVDCTRCAGSIILRSPGARLSIMPAHAAPSR